MTGSRVRQATPPRLRSWLGLAGPLRLASRLVARDLRYRPGTGLLLLVALLAATTTMTLALVVRDSAQAPWADTIAATAGPHIVATAFDADDATDQAMADLTAAPEVVAAAGPFPLLSMPAGSLRVHGRGIDLEFEVMARDSAPAPVDRPAIISGGWVNDGGVVVEESFAVALGLAVGDQLTIAGQPFTVAGVAVTTSRQPTPFYSAGLVWTTRADADKLVPAGSNPGKILMLRLADPNRAPAFAGESAGQDNLLVDDWQSTRADALNDVKYAFFGLIVGAVALALLAAAMVAVAVAGRIAAQRRRAALLKAAGATPRFVAAIMLAEYVTFALVAGAGGLFAGTYLAPVLAQPIPGVLGSAPVAYPSVATAALVLGTAVVLVGLSVLVPTIRAARASTVRSLASPARPRRRSRRTARVSVRLPVPVLLGLRLAGRRPGRVILAAAGLAVTVAAVVAALWMEAGIRGDTSQFSERLGVHAIFYDKLRLVTYTFIAALVVLALVNAILVAWTTALDNARNSALFRALGATPRQVTIGLTFSSVLPAIGAVIVGIPAGFAAFFVAAEAAGSTTNNPTPAAIGLLALLPATVVLIALLTMIPSRIAGQRPAIDALRTD